jgi:hypothetical protein
MTIAELETKLIDINGFQVPSSYHHALNMLIDALVYGEVNMGWRDIVNNGGTTLDMQSPVGFFLTTQQIDEYTKLQAPVEDIGEVNFEAMFSMHVDDITEVQSWFSHLKEQVTAGHDDANEARLAMIDWLKTLIDLRPDYQNPAIV